MITIQDTGINILRAYEIIKTLDTKETKSDYEAIKNINQKYSKEKLRTIDIISAYQKNSSLFLIIFSLMGAIIGFLARGFLIRRIEGGL
jgi:hypothetical protein